MTGSTLGHFQIDAKIGEGGMGAVFRAKDLSLLRMVAVKVLPPAMTSIPERKARFIHEAKAASSLQHPNIVTIFEIGAEAGVVFMAMELVEGQTLAALIPHRGMPLGEVLRIALQMADGLAKAHGAKIVHRDLKPSNVMVTPDGLVKILDFGLAKLLERGDTDTTLTDLSTEPGAILGTVSYMSPEQAEGRPVDARSDIFSFGAVLYEMLTGRKAFQKDSPAATIAAVIRDPADMAVVSGRLAGVISRCLHKELDRRFQTMGDVRAALLEAGETERKAAAWPKWLAAGAVLVGALAAGWWQSQDGLPPMKVVPLTSEAGNEISPTFSPDGTQVAYAWDGAKVGGFQLFVKLVGSPTALQLTSNPGSVSFSAWSPDGKWIAYQAVRDGRAGLYLISPLGGPERRIGDADRLGRLTWTKDGKFLAAAKSPDPSHTDRDGGAILLIPVDGGAARILLAPEREQWYQDPDMHPSGKSFAYLRCKGGFSAYRCEIRVTELNDDLSVRGAGRTVTNVLRFPSQLRWTANGEWLLCNSGSGNSHHLWKVSASGGAPTRVEVAGPLAGSPAIASRGNRVAFTREKINFGVWAMAEGGAIRPVVGSSLVDSASRFSPDGSRIAFVTVRGSETEEIWLAKSDGTGQTPLTNGPGAYQGSPAWSPDGKWIVYDSQDPVTSVWQIWMIESAGGSAKPFTNLPKGATSPFWSRDGQHIYYASETDGRIEIFRVPAKGGVAEQMTMGGGSMAQESPDGKTLYFTRFDGSPLYALPAGGAKVKVVITDSVVRRAFEPFDDGVYYLTRSGGKVEVKFHDLASGKARTIGAVDGTVQLYLFYAQNPPCIRRLIR